MRQGSLNEVEDGMEIGSESLFHLSCRDVFEAVLHMLLRSIINENVQPAEFTDGLVHGKLTESLLADISCDA